MSENDIKEELYSLLKQINEDIPNDKQLPNIQNIKNLSNCDSITLINYIKESLPILIEQKISEIISKNININNNNNFTKEPLQNNSNIIKQYEQLENQLKKLESDNRYYIKLYLRSGIQKTISEMKLSAYMSLEDEYEELREKVKYNNGKFLNNERKDNEILILRSENSSLKKDITKYERNIKIKEDKIKQDQITIQQMQKNIDKLNNKIQKLQKNIENNNNNNSNKISNKEKNNSMMDLDFKNIKNENYFTRNENIKKISPKNNNLNIHSIKSVYPHTLKIRKTLKFNLLRGNSTTHLENNKNSSNNSISINITNSKLIGTLFNKFVPSNNNNKQRNKKFPFATFIKNKVTKYKSFSMNKDGIKTKDEIYNKNINKKRIFKNILFSKQASFSPKSC